MRGVDEQTNTKNWEDSQGDEPGRFFELEGYLQPPAVKLTTTLCCRHQGNFNISDLLRPPYFFPETTATQREPRDP
nr:hypothetical protein Itr_chr04CG03510 [Ipomoea trifida]